MYRHTDKYEQVKHSPEYLRYIQSDEWKRKREARLRLDNYRCAMCFRGIEDGVMLECHHISYERLGNELIGHDLVTLCKEDHERMHNYFKRAR